jgi:hypothetical protein
MHSCMLRSIKPWRKGGVSQCLATLVRFLQICLRYLYRPHLEAFSLAYYLCSVTRFHETTGWTKIIPIQRRTGATSDACTLGWWAVEGFGPWHRIEQPIEKGEQRPDQRQKEMCAPIYNWHLVAAVERSNFSPVWHSSASPVELFFRKQLHEQLHKRGREPCFCSFTMCLTLWEWVFREANQRVGQRVGCLAIEVVKLLVKLLMKLYQTGPLIAEAGLIIFLKKT